MYAEYDNLCKIEFIYLPNDFLTSMTSTSYSLLSSFMALKQLEDLDSLE